jgi:hypothetical protein
VDRVGLAVLGPVRDPGVRAVRDLVGPVVVVHPADPAVVVHIRDPVALAVPRLVDPVALAVPRRAGLVGLAVPRRAGRVDLADLRRVDLVDQGMDPVHRAGLVDPVGLVRPGLVGRAAPADQGMDPADRAGLVDLVARVGRGMSPVDLAVLRLVDRVDLVDQGMDPVDRADPVGRVDPAGLVGRRHRRTRPGVLSTGVGPRWAAPGTCRTASAHPTTVHRPRPRNTGGAGMVGLRPERRRHSGTDRHLPVAGAVLRPRVVGIARGTVHRAIWVGRSVISVRSITTGTTRSRCSTRSSGDGASGSSDSGFRCTETP